MVRPKFKASQPIKANADQTETPSTSKDTPSIPPNTMADLRKSFPEASIVATKEKVEAEEQAMPKEQAPPKEPSTPSPKPFFWPLAKNAYDNDLVEAVDKEQAKPKEPIIANEKATPQEQVKPSNNFVIPDYMVDKKEQYSQTITKADLIQQRPSRYPISDIAQRLKDDIHNIAHRILPNGREKGDNWVTGDINDTPARKKSGSFNLCIKGTEKGAFYDHSNEDKGDVYDILIAQHGKDGAYSAALSLLGLTDGTYIPQQLTPEQKAEQERIRAEQIAQQQAEQDRQNRIKINRAMGEFFKGVPVQGTPAEQYLNARGIDAKNIKPDVMVYNPKVFYSKENGENIFLPALLCKYTDNKGNGAGVQRIFLNDPVTGKSIDKKMLGSVKGAAVRLYNEEEPKNECIIAEGVEDALAIKQAYNDSDVIASMGASNLASHTFPSNVTDVIIAPDNDKAGLDAADKLAKKLNAEGIKTRTFKPITKDFNADLIEYGSVDFCRTEGHVELSAVGNNSQQGIKAQHNSTEARIDTTGGDNTQQGITPPQDSVKANTEPKRVIPTASPIVGRLDLTKMEVFDTQTPATQTTIAPTYENSIRTGIIPLDRQIGICASTGDTLITGGLPMGDPLLIAAPSGTGKTTLAVNILYNYTQKRNKFNGKKANAIVISMESDPAMYKLKLLQVGLHNADRDEFGNKIDNEASNRLKQFEAENGRLFIDPWTTMDKRFFPDYLEAQKQAEMYGCVHDFSAEYPDGQKRFFYQNVYNTKATQQLWEMLQKTNPDMGRITFPLVNKGLTPDEIKGVVEWCEYKHNCHYDIVVIDYVQSLVYDDQGGRVSKAQGIASNVNQLTEWANTENKDGDKRLLVLISQLVPGRRFTPLDTIGSDDIAESKSIIQNVGTAIAITRTTYDRDYSDCCGKRALKKLPEDYQDQLNPASPKAGLFRAHVFKSRFGKPTQETTDCLLGVCMRSFAVFPTDCIDKSWVIKNDAEKAKEAKDKKEGDIDNLKNTKIQEKIDKGDYGRVEGYEA